MIENLKDIGVVLPSILMGALIPAGTLLALNFSPKRKLVAFKAALYGFGTFFVALGAVVIALLLGGQLLLPSVAISTETDANTYIFIGGSIALLLFYLAAEVTKFFMYENIKKQDRNEMAGLCFGSGFILAQNLLIFGLIYTGEIDMKQALSFGVLMMISGLIYLIISAIGYQVSLDGHRFVGPVIALSYYLMFAVMLLFANVTITYSFVAAVLIFNLVVGYILLPLPFKKAKGEENQ